MKSSGNCLNEAVALLEECASGKVSVEEFAKSFLHLTQVGFSVVSQLPSNCPQKDEIEEAFSALRSDCAQFQPDPELFAELMKTAAYPDEFLNQDGLRKRIGNTIFQLQRAGILSQSKNGGNGS